KGITYYDGGTDGRCFVVFDDKAVSVIERYNQAAHEVEYSSMQQFFDDVYRKDKSFASKMAYRVTTSKGGNFTILGSNLRHVQETAKHPLSVEQWQAIVNNIENAEYALWDNVVGSNTGKLVLIKITTPIGVAGVTIQFMQNGRATLSTAMFSNDKNINNWAKNKESSRTLDIEADGLQDRITGTLSLIDIIRNKLGIVNKFYQNPSTPNGQIAVIQNGKRIISLFKSADESTFVHEMAHMALADLKELAALENVAEQVKKDWAIVKEWASFEAGKSGVYKDTPWEKEFSKLEEEISACEQSGDTAEANRLKDVFFQERFARGFESYLKSGKAPTSALRSVFRQFKKWLTKIYKDFIGTGAMPSEAVREVMNRMVATQENIEQESRLAELHSLRKNKVFNEVDKSTVVMYERWQKEAREEAEERVLSKAMREAGSALQKEQKEALRQFREEERARLIKENKVFTAEDFLKRAGGDMSVLPVLHYTAESYAKELKKAGGGLEEVLTKAVEQKKQELGEVTEEKIAERAKEAFQTSEYRNRVLGLELEALKRKKELADKSNTKIIKKLEELKVINEKIEGSNTEEEKEIVKDEKRAKLADLRFSKDWSLKEERLLKNGEVEILKNIINSRQDHLKVLRDEAIKNVEVYKALAEKELARLPISEATATRLWINKEKRAGQRVQTALVAGKWEEAMRYLYNPIVLVKLLFVLP
ncbi:MAG: hypothetical protein RSD70_03850, partial [Acidaminococcaceae bacterium]